MVLPGNVEAQRVRDLQPVLRVASASLHDVQGRVQTLNFQ